MYHYALFGLGWFCKGVIIIVCCQCIFDLCVQWMVATERSSSVELVACRMMSTLKDCTSGELLCRACPGKQFVHHSPSTSTARLYSLEFGPELRMTY